MHQNGFHTAKCVMFDMVGSDRGVWYAIDACELLDALLGGNEAARFQRSWRCSSVRCAFLLQKVCLVCSSCWMRVWVLSYMVEAMLWEQ